mmetsp:Transcript_70392/g.198663  ORF Transcript_70392/g.198663 Transcript_70392/m.198663 type:complete len:230 (+) Transcript_70392:1101-1790(+)
MLQLHAEVLLGRARFTFLLADLELPAELLLVEARAAHRMLFLLCEPLAVPAHRILNSLGDLRGLRTPRPPADLGPLALPLPGPPLLQLLPLDQVRGHVHLLPADAQRRAVAGEGQRDPVALPRGAADGPVQVVPLAVRAPHGVLHGRARVRDVRVQRGVPLAILEDLEAFLALLAHRDPAPAAFAIPAHLVTEGPLVPAANDREVRAILNRCGNFLRAGLVTRAGLGNC